MKQNYNHTKFMLLIDTFMIQQHICSYSLLNNATFRIIINLLQNSQNKIYIKLLTNYLSSICASSYAMRDDHFEQRSCHTGDTWKVCCRYACGGGGWAHLSGQTATRTRPRSRCTASHPCGSACALSGGSSLYTPGTVMKWLWLLWWIFAI